MQVSIIIVSFNTCELLRNCLKSIYDKTKNLDLEIIVSDNGSKDGSIEMIKSEFPKVIVLENNANLGFGTANNRGLKVAKGEFIFYLNSDTLLQNNAVKIFYDYWKEHESESLGALGCNLDDGTGEINFSHGRFPSFSEELYHGVHHILAYWVKHIFKLFHRDITHLRKKPIYAFKTGEVDFICGADLFLKNNNYAKYDEKFFLYYEEVDLQCQMAKNNLKRVLIDGPKVIHLGRAGNRSVDEIIGYGSFSTIHHEISRVRYGKKNISKAIGLFLKAVTAIQWLSPNILKNTKPYFKTLMKV